MTDGLFAFYMHNLLASFKLSKMAKKRDPVNTAEENAL